MRRGSEILLYGVDVKAEHARACKRALSKFLEALKLENVRLEVTFLPDKEMTALKRRFLILTHRPVDVLSFPGSSAFPHPETKRRSLGEIYVNQLYLKGPFDHIAFLLAHGLLHLLGYDHEEKRDMLKMKTLERKFIASLKSK